MKKIIIAIAAGVLSFYSFASEITLNCQLTKTVFTQGENVTFDMTAVYPEVYKPYLWQAYMNAKKVPAGFCEKTGAYNNNHKTYPEIFIVKGDGKQPQKGYFRYPAVKASGEKASTFFSSANWPAGEYSVIIQTLFVHKKPAELKDKKKEYIYVRSYIKFTIQEPAAASAADAGKK